jgi:hypothetical protein
MAGEGEEADLAARGADLRRDGTARARIGRRQGRDVDERNVLRDPILRSPVER